jgi:hypothetical protein
MGMLQTFESEIHALIAKYEALAANEVHTVLSTVANDIHVGQAKAPSASGITALKLAGVVIPSAAPAAAPASPASPSPTAAVSTAVTNAQAALATAVAHLATIQPAPLVPTVGLTSNAPGTATGS